MTRADFLRPGTDVLTADDLDVEGKKVVLWDPATQQMSAGGTPVSGAWSGVAGDTASATANTQSLQNLIYLTGSVNITTPGVYYLNGTIYLRSNTRLNVGAGVILRQAPGTSKPMFVTESYTPIFATGADAVTAANLTSAGLVATLNQTGIGTKYPAGSFFALLGADQYSYDGVFRVETATADQITYKLSRAASASPSTGTIYIKAATINVEITGEGTIDYDQQNNNGASTLYDASCVIFEHAHKCRVSGINFRNAKKYCLWWSNTRDCISERQYFQTPSDGNHVCGPQRGYMKVQDLSGYCGDDIVGLSNGDNPTGELTRGEMDKVDVRNITGENTLLSIVSVCGGGDYNMRYWDLTIDGVYGSTAATAVNIYEYVTGGATLHSTSIAKLTLANVNPTEWSDAGSITIGGNTNGVKIDQLVIDRPRAQKTMTGQQSLAFIYNKAQVARVDGRSTCCKTSRDSPTTRPSIPPSKKAPPPLRRPMCPLNNSPS